MKYDVILTYERELVIPPGGTAKASIKLSEKTGVAEVRDQTGVVVDRVRFSLQLVLKVPQN